MDTILKMLMTVAAAALGGLLGSRLKLPAGTLLGAMLFTTAYSLITEQSYFYPDVRVVMQLLAGVMIGCRINLDVVKNMKKLILPILILVGCMLIINIAMGYVMYRCSSLDLATALFACAPGGASDMVIIAEDLGADPAYVGLLQLSRLLIIFSVLPVALKAAIGRIQKTGGDGPVNAGLSQGEFTEETINLAGVDVNGKTRYMVQFLLIMAVAAIVGTVFHMLGVVAGALIGSMLSSSVFCIVRGTVAFPAKLKLVMQVLSGAYIGSTVNRAIFTDIQTLLVPLLIMAAGVFLISFGVAFLINRLTGLDTGTAILGSTPGGQQEMSLISEDMDADTPSVAILQTSRLMVVIAVFPKMLEIVTYLLL